MDDEEAAVHARDLVDYVTDLTEDIRFGDETVINRLTRAHRAVRSHAPRIDNRYAAQAALRAALLRDLGSHERAAGDTPVLVPSGETSVGALPWSICGLPAIGYFAGYVTISVFGRPRSQSLSQADHSGRLGGVICFGGTFLCWILLLAVTSLI